ncbi:MAG: YegP family protein [Erysipelotrichaceae bacterium]|nr:YegP family protein [Erysipelotrichaceae bacterium]
MYFELLKSKNGKYYFVLKSTNGQIVAQSEMYEAKASAVSTINSIKTRVNPETEVKDSTK